MNLLALPPDVMNRIGDKLSCAERARLGEVCRDLRGTASSDAMWAGFYEGQRWVSEEFKGSNVQADFRSFGFVFPDSVRAPSSIDGEHRKVFEAIYEQRRLLQALDGHTHVFPAAALQAAGIDDIGQRSFAVKILARLRLRKAAEVQLWLQNELRGCLSLLGVRVGLARDAVP